MVDVKTFVASVVAVLSVCLQPEIRAQPTIGFSSKDESCSQLEDELGFQLDENMRLRSLLENERRQLRSQRVTATYISSFSHRQQRHNGITKVKDNIYVLQDYEDRIQVYEDLSGFRFMKDIALSGCRWPNDIVYSEKSKCVYISDLSDTCIWMMTTTGEHRLTKWLNNVNLPCTLSLSNEGHLLVLRKSQSFGPDSLEIYSLNATLIQRLQLSDGIKDPRHVVQTMDGNFIISHRLNNTNGPWVISQLTNDGQLINRFTPRNQCEILNNPEHLSLDSENNRLFVADSSNNRVILFASNDLTWSQVLVSKEIIGNNYPWRLFYDARKKHLFIAEQQAYVTVYEIN